MGNGASGPKSGRIGLRDTKPKYDVEALKAAAPLGFNRSPAPLPPKPVERAGDVEAKEETPPHKECLCAASPTAAARRKSRGARRPSLSPIEVNSDGKLSMQTLESRMREIVHDPGVCAPWCARMSVGPIRPASLHLGRDCRAPALPC